MQKIINQRSGWRVFFLALLLLLVQASAQAHELDHALDQHHELCSLHHYAGQHGDLPATGAPFSAPLFDAEPSLSPSYSFVSKSRPAPYAVRAPPQV